MLFPTNGLASEAARVVILSDVRLYREGLAASLARQPTLAVVGLADTSATATAHVVALQPDLVVLDVATARNLEMADRLRSRMPALTIIAFAVNEVEHEVLACAAAGVAAYVDRNATEQDMASTIEAALRGELRCPPWVAGLLFRRVSALSARGTGNGLASHLTQREHEVLGLIEAGLSNKEIAKSLAIEAATVKNHVHSILEKLNVDRRAHAVARMRNQPQQAFSTN